jgi:two-component system sensor histidine kinase KdpD
MSHHDQEPSRGRLKVFLGYASGVGKSFRMFDEARRRKERGQDVVAGALQPEIPQEIQPSLSAIETVPTLDVDSVPVMDVPAILRRHPQVVLVDGLAYDNPPGSRNQHRWQDVEELLAAGISVVGSVNVQYIDDQREAVEKITGKTVNQTIPRAFLNMADEIVIVDTPPSEASPSLSALREKALLLSADVIDSGLQRYLHAHGIEAGWRTHEHFLVYLTPGANVARMLSVASRNAARFHCDVLAVTVKQDSLSGVERKALDEAIREARAAGARVETIKGEDPVEAIMQFARAHGVTQIFAGQNVQRSWRTRLFGNPVNRLIRAARGMDVRVFPPATKGGRND